MHTRDSGRLRSAEIRKCARGTSGGSILQKYTHAHEGPHEAPFCRDTHCRVLVLLVLVAPVFVVLARALLVLVVLVVAVLVLLVLFEMVVVLVSAVLVVLVVSK